MVDLSSIGTIIGIDVETTSLDPNEGDIIEVAAIKYDLTKPENNILGSRTAEFVKLAKPENKITAEITALTGIRQDMVDDKPKFSEYVEKLNDFIGDTAVFAHNASFDVKWLEQGGINLKNNTTWDTFALASIAWPEAHSYNLGTLVAELNITVDTEHRAGDDVELTWLLLNKIAERLNVSKNAYQQASELLQTSEIAHYQQLFTLSATAKKSKESQKNQLQHDDRSTEVPKLDGVLGVKGLLEQKLPGFRHRSQQMEMATSIQNMFDNKESAFIEAGTGTGKTFGYLVPSILSILGTSRHSDTNGQIIISTHTKNLQDQLINHDIPTLLQAMNANITTASLKGRRNYLCITRLEHLLKKSKYSTEEAILLLKIIVWLDQGGTGDLEAINMSYQAKNLQRYLHADALSCRTICAQEKPYCPYQTARRKAKEAELVVINHALLVSIDTEEPAIALNKVIIDEAHHLEEVAREGTRRDFSILKLTELLAPLLHLKNGGTNKKHIKSECEQLIQEYTNMLNDLFVFMTHHTAHDKLLLDRSTRKSSKWIKIDHKVNSIYSRYKFIKGLVEGEVGEENGSSTVSEALNDADTFIMHLTSFIQGDNIRIQWLSQEESYVSGRPELVLNDVAHSAKESLSSLFKIPGTRIMTSATLSIAGDMSYIKGRIGLENAYEFKLGSPFDYKKQMLLYIVDDGPSPISDNFNEFTAKNISKLAKTSAGRLLGLFTSHKNLRQVYFMLVKELSDTRIKVLAQKLTGGRHNIAMKFKKDPHTVLLGASSFWEGIDVPGENLSVLVLPKLPFLPPNDPIITRLAETENINAFTDLSLPIMILKLRQGVGRLIRHNKDTGVVVIFDGRFLQKEYGNQVLASLPAATIHIGSKKDLPRIVKNWFGKKTLKHWQKTSK